MTGLELLLFVFLVVLGASGSPKSSVPTLEYRPEARFAGDVVLAGVRFGTGSGISTSSSASRSVSTTPLLPPRRVTRLELSPRAFPSLSTETIPREDARTWLRWARMLCARGAMFLLKRSTSWGFKAPVGTSISFSNKMRRSSRTLKEFGSKPGCK